MAIINHPAFNQLSCDQPTTAQALCCPSAATNTRHRQLSLTTFACRVSSLGFRFWIRMRMWIRIRILIVRVLADRGEKERNKRKTKVFVSKGEYEQPQVNTPMLLGKCLENVNETTKQPMI